jgi:hypothetical protein
MITTALDLLALALVCAALVVGGAVLAGAGGVAVALAVSGLACAVTSAHATRRGGDRA